MRFLGQSRDTDPGRDQLGRAVARRTRRATALLALGGLLAAGAAPARAGGLLEEPCFATCGQYRWFLAHDADVRDNGQCCMALIRQAKQNEERALELYEEARQPGLASGESTDLVRAGNRMIGKRTRKIRQFIDCVNGVISALGMQRRGLDPTAEYAAACGVSLQCEDEQ